MPRFANPLTLSDFTKLIKALELFGPIRQHYTISSSEKVQLPFEVTVAFMKLDKTLHDPEWSWMTTPAKTFFEEFLKHVVSHARSNWRYPNHENHQSEYLLGFLLHHNLTIQIDGKAENIQDLMFEQFPRVISNYIRFGIFSMNIYPLPAEGYDFLSENWRKEQNYPSLDALDACLTKCEEKERLEKQEKERQEQLAIIEENKQQAELERQEQLRQQLWYFQVKHAFWEILSLEQFSYVLEGFIKTGKVSLYNGFSINQTSILSPLLSTKIVHFANVTRRASSWQEKQQHFVDLLKVIIAEAKANTQHTKSAQLLLGFLLYHNFHIYDGVQVHKMNEIYWHEANVFEKCHLQSGMHSFPITNPDWQRQQGYPGRDTLEYVLSLPTAFAQPTYVSTNQQAPHMPMQGVNQYTPSYNRQGQQSQQSYVSYPLVHNPHYVAKMR